MNHPDDGSERELWRAYQRDRDRRVRNELVERHMGLARHAARRFTGRADDDVIQVAFLALVKAVDRFDPDRGVPFAAFAGRTIDGEIKRYFRDATWTIHVPRAAKELWREVEGARESLAQELGRSPSADEVAAYLEVDRDDVLQALAAGGARAAQSLDQPVREGGITEPGDDDAGYTRVEAAVEVEQLLADADPQEREIVRLRFEEDLSQVEIARRVGISQMQVSRVLRRTIDAMQRHQT